MFCKNGSHLRHNMRVSIADATSHGVMVGVGETYLPAFALAVGLGEVTAGLVGSIPLLMGGLLQLVTPYLLRRGVSEKSWVVGTSILQGLAFIPLMFAAVAGYISPVALLLCASLYWAGGLAGGPAWNSWIDKLIPKRVRANYFAGRTRFAQLATACGFLGGGVLLQWSHRGDWTTLAFALLFLIAWVARTCSVMMLAIHRSPAIPQNRRSIKLPFADEEPVGKIREVVGPRNLIVYLAMVQGMVQVSGPFFTPYILKQLQMSYIGFAVLVATAFLAKIVALATWGRFAKRQGAQWLLLLGGAMIIPLSSMWIVSSNFVWLMAVQLASGVAWAAYELGFFLLLFESVPIARRVKLLTIYNVANTSAWCAGALVGGSVLSLIGPSILGYCTLFAISSCGRALAFVFLLTRCRGASSKIREHGLKLLRFQPKPLLVTEGADLDGPAKLPSENHDLAA
jgi:MFS family permease